MKHSVLYLAYFFPPRGGAAVQRSLKFARYLPQFGWKALVVANANGLVDNATKVQDPTLLNEMPEGSIVQYTTLTDAEKRRYHRAQSKFMQRLNVTDPMRWWVEPAARLGLELARKHKPDMILATLSPFTAAAAGIELKRQTGLPLVFDLRDPWALDETRIYPTRWHAWRDRIAMSKALAAADLVIMNTPESASAVHAAFRDEIAGVIGGWPSKVIAITNGFDAADFEVAAQPAPAPDVLRIVHTGMFHSEWAGIWDDVRAGRGLINKFKYAGRPVNLWTRTPRYLLEAMQRVVASGAIPAGKLELVLVGELTEADRAMVEQSPAADMVKMLGYRSHAESVSWLKSADVLFLPNHTPLDGGPTLVVPGKTYEYLGSGRPVLAMCPRGDVRTFVETSGCGVAMDGDDVGGAVEALSRLYRAKQRGEQLFSPNRDYVSRFERRQLARRLSEALDELAETRAGSPAAVKP